MERFAFQYLEKQMENMEVQKLQKKKESGNVDKSPPIRTVLIFFATMHINFCESCNRYLVFIHTTETYLVARLEQAEGCEAL